MIEWLLLTGGCILLYAIPLPAGHCGAALLHVQSAVWNASNEGIQVACVSGPTLGDAAHAWTTALHAVAPWCQP